MENIILNFGGFYYSHHSELIEEMINTYYSDEDDIPDLDYRAIHADYSRYLVEFINEEIEINLRYTGLISPKYYNYTTDKIAVNVTKKDIKAIKKYISSEYSEDDIKAYIIDVTTEKSGYIPYYTYDEIMADDYLLIQCYFDLYFADNDFLNSWLQYYDMNKVYEMLYKKDYEIIKGV